MNVLMLSCSFNKLYYLVVTLYYLPLLDMASYPKQPMRLVPFFTPLPFAHAIEIVLWNNLSCMFIFFGIIILSWNSKKWNDLALFVFWDPRTVSSVCNQSGLHTYLLNYKIKTKRQLGRWKREGNVRSMCSHPVYSPTAISPTTILSLSSPFKSQPPLP